MSDPAPTNRSPIGLGPNQFKIDLGTLALTRSPAPGLSLDPWPQMTLAPYGAFLAVLGDAQVRARRFELFGADRKMLDRYAVHFSGKGGNKLKQSVLAAAQAAKIDPGLLGAVLLFEQESAKFWKDKDFFLREGLESLYQAGADDFLKEEENIRRAVPAARDIRVEKKRTFFDPERKEERVEAFVAVDKLILVTACMLKYKEIIARNLFRREMGNFDGLRQHEKFLFTRLAYNPGGKLLSTIQDFLKGKDVYDRQGPRSRKKPLRGATVCTALALHLNETIFGAGS